MVQAGLHDAASRQFRGKLGEKYHRLTPLLGGIVGCRWVPFADPKLAASLGSFYVSPTSVPGWLVATATFPGKDNGIEYINLIDHSLGLKIGDVADPAQGSVVGYLKDFQKAYPSRRSISIRVDEGYPPPSIVKSVQYFFQDTEGLSGEMLPGGIHLIFKDEPIDLEELEWQEPPLLAYHQPHDTNIGGIENPIDIYLLQGKKLGSFEQPSIPRVCPRGLGIYSVFTEPLMQLSMSGGLVNTSLHESGIGDEQDSVSLGSRYRSLLMSLDEVQIGKRVATINPGILNIQSSWIITPARYVDPAAMIAMVGTKRSDSVTEWTLWDYKLGIGGVDAGYFTLSGVPHDLKSILEGSAVLVKGDSLENILVELGKVGVSLASEVVRSNATAQGALGLVGALRLVKGTSVSDGLLKNDSSSVGFIIPVDSFKELFDSIGTKENDGDQRTDLLAIQINVDPENKDLMIGLLGIEAKYTSNTLSKERAQSAANQASETVKRVTELANRSLQHALERLAFLKLISHGLRLSAMSRNFELELDANILNAILTGQYAILKLEHNTFVVSTEIKFSGKAKLEMSPAVWVRLSPGHWPSLYAKSSKELAEVQRQLTVFRDANLIGTSDNPDKSDKKSRGDQVKSQQTEGPAHTEWETDVAQVDRKKVLKNDENPPMDDIKTEPVETPVEHQTDVGVKVVIGHKLEWPNEHKPVFFHPRNTALNQPNVGIVGDLGTGKTQKIKALIRDISQQAVSNRGQSVKFLIFDYKGDYTSEDFSTKTGARVITPRDIPLNILDTRGAEGIYPELDRANFMVDIFTKIYGGIGPKQRYMLKTTIRDCYKLASELGTLPTIYNVREKYMESIKTPDSVFSILDDFTSYKIFEEDLTKIKSFEDFFTRIIVIDLKSLGPWDQGKNMLVVMFLNFFYDYMMNVEKKPFLGDRPQLRALDSFLLIDEADQIMSLGFPVLKRILLQGREFGIGVILASQYLSHFKQDHEDYREPLLTWLIHKVPNISVKELTEIGVTDATNKTAAEVKSLDTQCSYYKTSIGEPCFIQNVTFFNKT